MQDHHRQAILELLPLGQHILDDPKRLSAALGLLGAAAFGQRAYEYRDMIYDAIWSGLQHPSGTVRQSARQLLDNSGVFRAPGSEYSADDAAASMMVLLNKIEELIRQYQPNDPPPSIAPEPPSVYKTLVLAWHDIAWAPRLTNLYDMHERMDDLGIPPYEDENDTPEAAGYTLTDWQASMEQFVTCAGWPRVQQLLHAEEQRTLEYLDWALRETGTRNERTGLLRMARSYDLNGLNYAAMRLVNGAANMFEKPTPQSVLRLMRHIKLLRAIEMLGTNTVYRSTKGNAFSNATLEMILQEQYKLHPQRIDLLPVLEHWADAHQAIDDIRSSVVEPQHMLLKEMYAKARLGTYEPPDLTEHLQTIHYLLDKLLITDYRAVAKRSPRQLAALLYRLFTDLNPWAHIAGIDNKTLAQYGGWSGPSGVYSAAMGMRYNLLGPEDDRMPYLVVQNEDDLQLLQSMEQFPR